MRLSSDAASSSGGREHRSQVHLKPHVERSFSWRSPDGSPNVESDADDLVREDRSQMEMSEHTADAKFFARRDVAESHGDV